MPRKKLAQKPFDAFVMGYGKADITPVVSERVGLAGNNDQHKRKVTGVLEPIWANCVAFTDTDNTTVLVFGMDLHSLSPAMAKRIRRAVRAKTGVPDAFIQLNASHNHSGPDIGSVTRKATRLYNRLLVEKCVQAAVDAMESRKQTKMYFTFIRPEKMMFVRHYLLLDGTYQGQGLPFPPQESFCGYSEKGDNLLQMVKFTREGEKDVVMINWQGHPHAFTGDPATYTQVMGGGPAVMRQVLLQKADTESIYIMGPGGNGVQRSFYRPHNEHIYYKPYGEELGDRMIAAFDTFREAQTGKIFYEYTEDVSFPGYENRFYPLGAFGFGDFGYVSAPGEMFQANVMPVRESSPYKFTFYAQLSNGGDAGYVPDARGVAYGCYECGPCFCPLGSGEVFQKLLTEMIQRVFTQSGQTVKEKDPGYITDHSPKKDGIHYENPGLPAVAVNNGFYQIKLLANGQEKTLLVENQGTAEAVLKEKHPKLLLSEQNVVVGIE